MVKDDICRQVDEAHFYGHMVDETTDFSNKNQMCLILRYVYEGNLCERFWGFSNVSNLSGNTGASCL